MVIKVQKQGSKKEATIYKSLRKILTPQDIIEADKFDDALKKEIEEIEKILLRKKMLAVDTRKTDMLKAWHLIGTRINKFLKRNKILPEEEKIFWDSLYGRSSVINKTIPEGNIGKMRNDFRTASILSQRPIKELEKIGSWALWREMKHVHFLKLFP